LKKNATPLLLIASFLSGAASLNYQLLWVREIALVAGSTQAAISVVLSVFFLGLALGNYLAGRWARTMARPVAAYAGVEAIIALWALVFPFIMQAAGGFYAHLYASLQPGSAWLHVLRTASAAMMLLVPTTCMGATIPLLVQFGARDLARTPRWSAWLYGVNTLGALTGVAVTGFVLIQYVGVSRSMWGTALLNGLCIVCVLPWAGTRRIEEAAVEAVATRPGISALGKILLVSFGLLGVCNIAVEVLWTRFYALIYYNDTYMFSVVLMVYLFGVGAGSLIGDMLVRRVERPVHAIGTLQVISAVWTIAMMYLVPMAVVRGDLISVGGFAGAVVRYLIAVNIGVLVPTLCMGATFPLLVRAATAHREQAGEIVGRALSWNTIGGVVGALVAGYWFLDRLGMETGLFIVAGTTATIGLMLSAFALGFRGLARGGLKWGVLAALVLVVVSPPHATRALLQIHLGGFEGAKCLEVQPSVHGMAAVTEEQGGYRRLWVNSSWIGGEGTGLVSGYVPWIFHQRPIERALGLCMGSGGSFGALTRAAHCRLDVVEINREVVHLAGKWLAQVNNGLVQDPQVHIVLDDARHYVRYNQQTYDLLTIEPMQPFQKGTAYFYTREFYAEARARLNDGAIICQFLPIALSLDEQSFKSIVRTFVESFPNAVLWGPGQYSVLIGYVGDHAVGDLDVNVVLERMRRPDLRADFNYLRMQGPYDVFAFALCAGDDLRRFSADGDIYTDDRPSLEFTAARRDGSLADNLRILEPYLTPIDAMFRLRDQQQVVDLTELRQLHIALASDADDHDLIRRIITISYRLYGIDGVPEKWRGMYRNRPGGRPAEARPGAMRGGIVGEK